MYRATKFQKLESMHRKVQSVEHTYYEIIKSVVSVVIEKEEVALGTMQLLEWPRKMINSVQISQHVGPVAQSV